MRLIRRVARAMMAVVFIQSGSDVLRNPEGRAATASPMLEGIRRWVPALPRDDVALVRFNAALQVAAGAMLALDRAPRLAAAALAGSLVPTTVAGHPFWRMDDPVRRGQQLTQFTKNLAILGGLLLVATGAEGKRSRRARSGTGTQS